MTKGVKICLIVVIVLFIGSAAVSVIVLRPKQKKESVYVQIVQENNVIRTIDIANSEDMDIRIESPDGGYNIVSVRNGEISITEADCPDRTCINSEALRSEYLPIVCLPHKLVIRYL